MPERLRVLIVEDNENDAELVLHELRQSGYAPEWTRVCTEDAFRVALKEHWDIVLADYGMPRFSGPRALQIKHAMCSDVPLIVVTGSISEEVAVDCLKGGAADYLLKDRLGRLGQAVASAIRAKHLRDSAKRSESLREMIVRELNHRVKNNLSVVLSLINQTRRNSKTYEEFVSNFNTRIRALANVHELLAANNWSGATFTSILSNTLVPFIDLSSSKISLDGSDVVIPAGAVQMLGMVLNELVTNAIQHGALSTGEGAIAINWRTVPYILDSSDVQALELNWVERDIPAALGPVRDGYGLTLIRQGIPHELRGVAEVEFKDRTFRYRAVIPLQARDAPPSEVIAEAARFSRERAASPA